MSDGRLWLSKPVKTDYGSRMAIAVEITTPSGRRMKVIEWVPSHDRDEASMQQSKARLDLLAWAFEQL